MFYSACKFFQTSTDKQAEVTNNLRAAVSLGLELVRARFKRIDMRPEDFDEVDDPTFMPEPMFEPYVQFYRLFHEKKQKPHCVTIA